MYTLSCKEKELKELYIALCSFEVLPSHLWNLQKKIGRILTKKITVNELITMQNQMKLLFLGKTTVENEKQD